jgi:hypothetical protein
LNSGFLGASDTTLASSPAHTHARVLFSFVSRGYFAEQGSEESQRLINLPEELFLIKLRGDVFRIELAGRARCCTINERVQLLAVDLDAFFIFVEISTQPTVLCSVNYPSPRCLSAIIVRYHPIVAQSPVHSGCETKKREKYMKNLFGDSFFTHNFICNSRSRTSAIGD